MCKKSLLMMLLLALLVPWAANAQTSLWSEDFEDGSMPTGWTTDGPGTWSVGIGDYSASTGAGHGSYNAKITHGTTGNVTKLITPEIDLSSVTSAELSFMHVQRSWAGDIDQLRVYYRTSSSGTWTQLVAYTAAISSWTTEDGIVLPNLSSTYQLAFEHTDKYGYGVGLDNIVIVQGASCVKPAALAVTPNGQSAILTWAGDAASFSVAHSLDATAAPDDNIVATVSTTTYTMDNLALDQDHYFWVRANCSATEQSDWTGPVSEHIGYCVPAPTSIDNSGITNVTFGIEDYIVNNSTHPSAAPYYGDYTAQIGAVQAGVEATVAITYATRYTYNTYVWVDLDNSLSFDSDEVVCYGESSSTSPTTLTLHFTIPVNQTLGDYRMRIGGADSGLGSDPANANPCYSLSYGIFEDYTLRVLAGPSCWQPSAPEFARITITSADVAWTPIGTETQWQLCINGDEDNLVLVDEPAYSMTNLTPDTEYTVKVRAYCSADDQSTWSASNSFSTLVACDTPTNLAFADITAYSANVSWTSENTNIEMRYTSDMDPNNDFETSSLRGWTNIDADGDGFEWVLASEAAGVYHNAGVDVTGQGHNDSHDFIISGSYSNVYGVLTPDNYLVSPQVTLGGSISFWVCAQDATDFAEHFGVAVSTTSNSDPDAFTTIAEWTITNSSKGAVLREANHGPRGGNRGATPWVQYTVDLSAYSGQGYVAIRHFNCTNMFLLNLDDIVVEQPGGFQVNWTDVPNPTNPQGLTNLEPATTYLVQVRAYCEESGYSSSWLEGTFTTLPACMVPTGLVVSNIDKRSADLAWVSNGDEEAWQICVNGDMDNLIYVTDTAYTLTDLLPDQTQYIVKVRAYCDETLHSDWSTPVVFYTLIACPAPTNLTVADITRTSAVVSWTSETDIELQYAEDVWMHYDNNVFAGAVGYGTEGQRFAWASMFPADMLTSDNLTHVALYESASRNHNDITLIIYQGGETAPETQLYTETFTPMGEDGWHEVMLATPVTINPSQNLWVVFSADDAFPAMACADMGTVNNRWTSLDNGTTWDDLPNYGVSGRSWMIRAAFENNTQLEWIPVANAATPQNLTGLTPETNYYVRVKDICGGIDGESVWTSAMFTTEEGCPAPEALAATPYALSAVLSWDEGEGYSESYTVSYREPEHVVGAIEENFATNSVPTGWTRYSGLVDQVVAGTATLTTYSGGWNPTTYALGSYNMKVNIYGTGCKYWLVSPEVTLTNGGNLDFDLALTDYGNADPIEDPTAQADDRFVVLVYANDAWTILREWNNSGSDYVYNNIATTGEAVSIDLSAYEGQAVKIAFYGESTVGSNGDNDLHIDNVLIGNPTTIPATAWETVTVDEATATITGLTPETTYEWKVQGNCGDYGLSEESVIASFTTTNDLCPVPTNLTVVDSLTTATTADLRWNASPDVESFTVRYRGTEHVVGGISEGFGASIPTGWAMYTGLLDTVMVRPSALTAATYGWAFGASNGVFDGDNHARVNIYGNYQRWLVTPAFKPTDGTFTFDMALTKYSGTLLPVVDSLQQDDKFIVLISTDNMTTWTILREWNNSGSSYVYNTIATEGEAVSIDLSAYVGQSVRIAFYGESTNPSDMANTGGDNNLHIDNVVIGNPVTIPATDWMYVDADATELTLTGLTPETPYVAQVMSACSADSTWSNTATFTTLEQTILTQTIALNAGWNWISANVVITMNDLKDAIVAAYPTAGMGDLSIKALVGGQSNYNPNIHKWIGGPSTIDLSQMYRVKVPEDGEIMLEGMPIDPTAHPVTIKPGANWIGFPFSESMTVTAAFDGFPTRQDNIKSETGQTNFNGSVWIGGLKNLEPGKGYIYNSKATTSKTFVYPTNTSKK